MSFFFTKFWLLYLLIVYVDADLFRNCNAWWPILYLDNIRLHPSLPLEVNSSFFHSKSSNVAFKSFWTLLFQQCPLINSLTLNKLNVYKILTVDFAFSSLVWPCFMLERWWYSQHIVLLQNVVVVPPSYSAQHLNKSVAIANMLPHFFQSFKAINASYPQSMK